MKFSLAPLVLLPSVLAAVLPSAPVQKADIELSPRSEDVKVSKLERRNGQVELCLDDQYRRCQRYTFSGGCDNLHGSLHDSITSYKMLPGTRCAFFEHHFCQGAMFWQPHESPNVGQWWNDRISSISCYWI